ncbi:MAG: hypothetical protein GF330_14325 [Candidatus Eisenbacteria bacterium]|nr:hypothetical protein [Candidatus Eisenbacteria bacterium]
MRILVLATIPFEGLRRRQQQVALGLAARGNEVLYLEPPRPVRSLVDPARFEPAELDNGGKTGRDDSGAEEAPAGTGLPDAWAQLAKEAELRTIAPHLTIARKGVGMAKMGAWGWAARLGWRLWAGQVERLISDARAEVVLVYHPALIGAARAALEAPIIFECLDDFPSLVPSSSIAVAYDEALRSGLPQVDGFLAVNRYLLESWGRFLREGVPVRVIEHGVDLSMFRPATPERRTQARERLHLAPDVPVGAYLGRFDARLSYADLELIFDRAPELRLLLLGEVSSEGEDILQRLPHERIHRLGPLRPGQAAELIAAADLTLLTLRREPHLEPIRGLKLYEYLATGLPVLASFRRAVKAFREALYLYTDAAELEVRLREALGEAPEASIRAERVRIARENGWQLRIGEIADFLTEVASSAEAHDG